MTTLTDRPSVPIARSPAAAVAPRRWPATALFIVLAISYFGVGCLLMMRYNLFDPDATSRVANAGYVLMSRDPHLSAVGFVWNPLPSLVEVPVLEFARWWPELRTHGLAAVVQSAGFMAAAALMVRRIALDRGVGSGWRRVAVACFALQPMIVVYGASGMSEAAETFCLLWCTRHLMRWSDEQRTGDLAWAALALSVGYLARYEVVPAAFGAAAFVIVLTWARAAAGSRAANALSHMAIILFPIATTAAIWALTGWVVNEELFATLSSRYGNDSQVAGAMERGGPLSHAASADWVVISARLFGMQPFVGIAAAGAVVHAVLARKPTATVPVVIFGSVLAFAAWGQYSSTTFGWFRFYLLAIPLVVCVALACWEPDGAPRRRWATETRSGRLAAVLLSVSILFGFPVTVGAMLNERIGNQQLQFGFNSLLHPGRFPAQDQWYRRLMVNDRILADYLDRQRLPDGAVLMDTFNTWGVWLSSDNPKQFTVSSDFDFKAELNRPWQYGVKYLLVSNPAITDADALNIRYPTLWNDGAGMSKLDYTIYGATGDERFRLYRVTGPPQTPAGTPTDTR